MCSFNKMLNEAFCALVNSVLASIWVLNYYIRITLNGRRSQSENQRKKERHRKIVTGECKNSPATAEAENRGMASRLMLKGNISFHILQDAILRSRSWFYCFHSFFIPFLLLSLCYILTMRIGKKKENEMKVK